MSGPAGVRRPICVFCRHVPHNPTTSTGRRAPQALPPRVISRPASTHVYIPKKYGEDVGKTREKILEDRYFTKLMRSQEEPPIVVPDHLGSSKTTLDFRMGRFYELQPVDAITDILAHDFPRDYFWPNPRTPPEVEVEVEWGRTWRDIDWLGWKAPVNPKDRRGNKLKLECLREAIAKDMTVQSLYFSQIDILKNNVSKYMVLLEAFRIYIKQQSWDKFQELLELLNLDSHIRPYLRRGIQNQLFKELAIHAPTKETPKEVVNALTVSFHRPFTNEALLFLLDHIKLTATNLKLFYEDHGILPHITVSNKAFSKEIKALEKSRKWPKRNDEPRTDPAYYKARRRLYRQFTRHFDADRVNAESIRILLKYAVDRDEVKRIWDIAIQAAKRDPTILYKNQHIYLEGLIRFPMQYEGPGNADKEMKDSAIIYHNAEALADVCGVIHTLRKHGQQLNRDTLIALITEAAKYGSSTTMNMLLPKLVKSRWTLTPRELREVIQWIPQESSADLITQRHRIIGTPRAWVQHQQKLVLTNYLRQFVGNSESCLVSYVRALGRCGATYEVWQEWYRLRERGFKMVEGSKVVKDGTLAAFVASLGAASDKDLVKRCFAQVKAFKATPMFQKPMFLAGLLACRPSSLSHGLGQQDCYPLFEAVKQIIGDPGVMEKVRRRMRSGSLNLNWSPLEKRTAKIIWDEADRSVRRVLKGEDLTWAESALMQLLEKVSRDGSVPDGKVSVMVKWPESQTQPNKDVRL